MTDMSLSDIPAIPPPRLTIKEVLAISGLSRASIAARQKEGTFPKEIYRCGRGNVYNGAAVYKALGFTVETKEDPFNVDY